MKRLIIVILLSAATISAIGCDRSQGGDSRSARSVEPEGESEATDKAASDEAQADNNDDGKAQLGQPAPDFELRTAADESWRLSDHRGEIVVLEWTSMKCPFVTRHYADKTMHRTLQTLGGPDAVSWVTIDSSASASPQKAREWKKEQAVSWPVLQDPSGRVGKAYGAKTALHMVVIDQRGVVRYRGAIDDAPRGEKKDPTNFVLGAVRAVQDGQPVEPAQTRPYGCMINYAN